jgi:hypothetical protein
MDHAIQMALQELAQAHEGLIIRQNEIYDPMFKGMNKTERAQFKMHSNIILHFQVLVADVQTAIVVMITESTEAYKELSLALSEQIQCSGTACRTHFTLPYYRECAQETLVLQLYLQWQELAALLLKS